MKKMLLDEEDKEDILDYLAWKWEREKRKREKDSKHGSSKKAK